MSRTRRKILSNHNPSKFEEVDDSLAKNRSNRIGLKGRAYTDKSKSGKQSKYKIGETEYSEDGMAHRRKTGRAAREAINNANRSLKKTVRQNSKKDIKKLLNGE